MIDELVARMEALQAPLEARKDARRYFHGTYLRTTRAVGAELETGGFVDPPWVERWDVAFAGLYLDALEADQRGEVPSGPWKVAFAAADEQATALPPLRHVLLGMNAHINYDLPQALLEVIDDQEFQDPELLARRSADHRQIDTVLAARVGAEDTELDAVSGPRSLLDRVLTPANRLGTKRFLEESRAKVWAPGPGRLHRAAHRAGAPGRQAGRRPHRARPGDPQARGQGLRRCPSGRAARSRLSCAAPLNRGSRRIEVSGRGRTPCHALRRRSPSTRRG